MSKVLRVLKNRFGFGLVEVLLAATLVLIIALVAAQFIVTSKSENIKVEGNTFCHNRVESVVSAFKNIDNKASISNWHSTMGATRPTGALGVRFGSLQIIDPPGNPVTFDKVNTWLLINSGVNEALNLYNHSAGSCSSAAFPALPPSGAIPADPSYGIVLSAGMMGFPSGTSLPHEQIYVNIKRLNLSTGATDCLNQGSQKMISLGLQNSATPETHMGFQVQGIVTYLGSDNIPGRCIATIDLSNEGDTTPPTFVNPGLPPAGPGAVAPAIDVLAPTTVCATPANCCVAGSPFCFNVPSGGLVPIPTACGTNSSEISFAVNEPGAVFACRVEFSVAQASLPGAPTAAYQPCTSYTDTLGGNAISGTITATHGVPDGFTAVRFSLGNLPQGYFRLFVKAYDSAQNETMVQTDFYTRVGAPGSSITLIPPSPLIGPFPNPLVPGTVDVPTGHLDSSLSAGYSGTMFTTQLFQCVQGAGVWTAVYPPGVTAGQWQFGSGETSAGCVASMAQPNPINVASLPANGLESVTVTGCDACDPLGTFGGGTSATLTWTVDLNASPLAPAIAGGAFQSFVGPADPIFNLAPAKASGFPFTYTCQSATAPNTYVPAAGTVAVCQPNPIPFSPKPCTSYGSAGFCTRAFDGCGRTAASTVVNYEILSYPPNPCTEVACAPGNYCDLATFTCVAGVGTGYLGPISFAGFVPPNSVCPNLTSSCGAPACGAPPGTGCPAPTAAGCSAMKDTCGNQCLCCSAAVGVGCPAVPPPCPTALTDDCGRGCACTPVACVPAPPCPPPTQACPGVVADSCGNACGCTCSPVTPCGPSNQSCPAAMPVDSCGNVCACGAPCTCNPVTVANTCAGSTFADSCGTANACTGTLAGVGCVGGQSCPASPLTDTCGAMCPCTGTPCVPHGLGPSSAPCCAGLTGFDYDANDLNCRTIYPAGQQYCSFAVCAGLGQCAPPAGTPGGAGCCAGFTVTFDISYSNYFCSASCPDPIPPVEPVGNPCIAHGNQGNADGVTGPQACCAGEFPWYYDANCGNTFAGLSCWSAVCAGRFQFAPPLGVIPGGGTCCAPYTPDAAGYCQ